MHIIYIAGVAHKFLKGRARAPPPAPTHGSIMRRYIPNLEVYVEVYVELYTPNVEDALRYAV